MSAAQIQCYKSFNLPRVYVLKEDAITYIKEKCTLKEAVEMGFTEEEYTAVINGTAENKLKEEFEEIYFSGPWIEKDEEETKEILDSPESIYIY